MKKWSYPNFRSVVVVGVGQLGRASGSVSKLACQMKADELPVSLMVRVGKTLNLMYVMSPCIMGCFRVLMTIGVPAKSLGRT